MCTRSTQIKPGIMIGLEFPSVPLPDLTRDEHRTFVRLGRQQVDFEELYSDARALAVDGLAVFARGFPRSASCHIYVTYPH